MLKIFCVLTFFFAFRDCFLVKGQYDLSLQFKNQKLLVDVRNQIDPPKVKTEIFVDKREISNFIYFYSLEKKFLYFWEILH